MHAGRLADRCRPLARPPPCRRARPAPTPHLRRYGQPLVDAAAEAGIPYCLSYISVEADGSPAEPQTDLFPPGAKTLRAGAAGGGGGAGGGAGGEDKLLVMKTAVKGVFSCRRRSPG